MQNDIYYVCKYTPLEIIKAFGYNCKKFTCEYSNFDCAESCTHPNMCGWGKSFLEEIMQKNIKKLILVNCCDVCVRIFDILKEQNNMDFLFLFNLPHKNDNLSVNLIKSEIQRLISELEKFSSFEYKTILENLDKTPDKQQEHILLIGAHTSENLLNIIKDKSPYPVYDYTCGSYRQLNFNNIDENNFLDEYASKLLNQKHPCSRMQFSDKNPISDMTKGIIYNNIKFCDYWGIKQRKMKEFNIPILNIETDYTTKSTGQILTRIDAFFENLKPQKIQVKNTHKYFVGIDIGSTSTKAVMLDKDKNIIASTIIDTGFGASNAANTALNIILKQSNIKTNEINSIITTGYGRNSTELTNKSITEISCHAKGAYYLCPTSRTIIDIGGQDLKVICIDEFGNVKNFVMNDKCAAGTGRFLEVMAKTLKMDINEMSKLGNNCKNEIEISSMCTVFAESEVVSLISNNTSQNDIIYGLNMSVASKIYSLTKRLNCEKDFIMTGGVSKNIGVVNAIQTKLNCKLYTSKNSQLCGSIGAALFGID
jgi:predicted CoA-substrate-specific enzyme activase